MSAQEPHGGSYRMPRAEHARVADAMRHGVLKCPESSSLRDAARTMCNEHVHMVAVTSADGAVVGVLSDMKLLDALLDASVADSTLEHVMDREPQMISTDAPLREAAELMRARGRAHLLVRDAHNGHPVGVLSTLDVAGILAWGEA